MPNQPAYQDSSLRDPATEDQSLTEAYSLVLDRVCAKLQAYAEYGFDKGEANALNIFFDLAQEYENAGLFYLVPVVLLQKAFGVKAEFFLRRSGSFELVSPPAGSEKSACPLPEQVEQLDRPFEYGGIVYIPVRGRYQAAPEQGQPEPVRRLLGVLAIDSPQKLTEHDLLYYEKFANRIGVSLQNRMLSEKNKNHISFVRNLVQDIGHNVLGPNMFFKLLIHQLDGNISRLGESLSALRENGNDIQENNFVTQAYSIYQELLNNAHEINQHFSHSSLFLESLLRESHFVQGEYVLRCQDVDVVERVVKPQFAHYHKKLAEKNIDSALIIDLPTVPCTINADVGLLSQVLANLLSNAFKYAEPQKPGGKARTECRVSFLPDFFKPGQCGVKVAVHSSGQSIEANEALHLFEKYFRASNTAGISGTGKGLYFVQEIVGHHHGACGYERQGGMNVFYFIVPVVDAQTRAIYD